MYRIIGYDSETSGYFVLDTNDCSVDSVTEAELDTLVAQGIGLGEHELQDRESGLYSSPEQGMFGSVLRITDDLYLIPFANTMDNQMYLYIMSCKTGAFNLVAILRVLNDDKRKLPASLLNFEEVLTTEYPLVVDKPNKKLIMLRVSSDADSYLLVYNEIPKPRSKFTYVDLYECREDNTYKGYMLFVFDEDTGTAKTVNSLTEGFRLRPLVSDMKLVYEDKEVADLTEYM